MELTKGYLDALWAGTTSTDDVQPVLQVESIKSVGKSCERFQIMLSDGERLCPGALATQLQGLVNDALIISGSIVRLVEKMINQIENRKLLIILSVEVLEKTHERIGDPQPPSSAPGRKATSPMATRAAVAGPNVSTGPLTEPSCYGSKRVTGSTSAMRVKNEIAGTVPISALNPYMSKWTVKARVTAKSETRTYTNARGEGKVFSFDLLDAENGEIRASCFNRDVDTFYDTITVGSIYTIYKCQLKPVQRPEYNHLRNANELFLESGTAITLMPDDGSIETQHFIFQKIADLQSVEAKTVVDLIGIVSSCSLPTTLQRKNGTETHKRVCLLRDQSGSSVELTMWGPLCFEEGQQVQDLCDANEFPVLALKAGRVSDFGGKSVSTISSSQLLLNPDRQETHDLRRWSEGEGQNVSPHALSKEGGGVRTEVCKTIAEMKEDEGLGRGPKADYITLKAAIAFAKAENFCYKSCPNMTTEGKACQKKVTEDGNIGYFCEKCNLTFPTCDHRYLLQVQLQDDSGSSWFTAFQVAAEEILGVPAKELEDWKSEEDPRAALAFSSLLFKQRLFKIKLKEEVWNDEARVKLYIMNSEPIDYAEECKSLLASIHRLAKGEAWAGLVGGATPQQGMQPSNPAYGYNSSSTCHKCGQQGHWSKDCPGGQIKAGGGIPTPFNIPGGGNGYGNKSMYGKPSAYHKNESMIGEQGALKGGIDCYHCHQPGHWARDCPNKGVGMGMGNDGCRDQAYASYRPVQSGGSYGGGGTTYGGNNQGSGQNGGDHGQNTGGGHGQNTGGYGQNTGGGYEQNTGGGYGQNTGGGYGQNAGGNGQNAGGYVGGGGYGSGSKAGYGDGGGAAGATVGYGSTTKRYGSQQYGGGYGGQGASGYGGGGTDPGYGGHNGNGGGNGYNGNGTWGNGGTGCGPGGGPRMQ